MTNLESQSSKSSAFNRGEKGVEVRREYANQELAELLSLMSEKMAAEVTFDGLSKFGEAGENVMRYYNEISNGQIEFDLMLSQAHLTTAINNLKKQVEGQH